MTRADVGLVHISVLVLGWIGVVCSDNVYDIINRPSCGGRTVRFNGIRVNTTDRLKELRSQMVSHSVAAYIVPTADEHQSEYTSEYDERRFYISGFSGSAGTAIVTSTAAALWTDGRYFLQAEDELDCNWILMKDGLPGYPTWEEWLAVATTKTAKVGVNPSLLSEMSWGSLDTSLTEKHRVLTSVAEDLIDLIWTDRPAKPTNPVFVLNDTFAGKSWQDKVEDIRKELTEHAADALVVTALDETAWLLNLRGSDVPYTPFFKSYIIVGQSQISLYIDSVKVTDEVRSHLNTDSCGTSDPCVKIHSYENFVTDLMSLGATSSKLWLSPSASHLVHQSVPEVKRFVKATPPSLWKAVKNPTEAEGMQNAHIRDAVALIRFVAMLEEQVQHGAPWDELSAVAALDNFRSMQDHYMNQSFDAISAFGPNGAVIHYFPQESTNLNITTDNLYLLDSGGQYLDGTTDVTRTFHFGEPNEFQKVAYTHVLMAHINLARLVFPDATLPDELDFIARSVMYQIGLDYLHGTGHGIGAFLGVHEGPTTIRNTRKSDLKNVNDIPDFQPNMFFSDEPGFYKDGEFGIRLENIVRVVNASTEYSFNNVSYLTFEPVTLVPFEPKLIKRELLDFRQTAWLDAYHKRVDDEIGPILLQEDVRAYNWLRHRVGDLASEASSRFQFSPLLAVIAGIVAAGI